MSEYTPTTEEVRSEWAESRADSYALAVEHADAIAEAEFDRWLAEVERAAAARALEEAADGIHADPRGWRVGVLAENAFHAGADAVYDALRARAAEIRGAS